MLYKQILTNRATRPKQNSVLRECYDDNFLTVVNSKQSKSYTFLELTNLVDELERSILADPYCKADLSKQSLVITSLANCLELILLFLLCAKREWVIMPLSPTVNNETLKSTVKSYQPKLVFCGHTIDRTEATNRTEAIDFEGLGYVKGENSKVCVFFNNSLSPSGDSIAQHLTKTLLSLEHQNSRSGSSYILTTTSGTTSQPKWMCLGQGTKLQRAESFFNVFGFSENDRFIIATPLHHSLAQRILFTSLLFGEHCVLLEHYSDELLFNNLENYRVSVAVLVSTQIKNLLDDPDDRLFNIPSLKSLVSTSAKLDNSTRANIVNKKNFSFYECYGASELAVVTSLALTKNTLLEESFGSVGKAIDGVEIEILDDLETAIDINQIGEICVNSPLAFMGYIESHNPDVISKSYVKTGDLGYLDENGYLYFVGRKKERINVGGVKVYPELIENLAREYLNTVNTSKFYNNYNIYAIPYPDKRLGEVVALVIIADNSEISCDLDFYEFSLFLMEECDNVQLPRHFFVLYKVPKTELGKIRRVKLAEYVAQFDISTLEKSNRYFCCNY